MNHTKPASVCLWHCVALAVSCLVVAAACQRVESRRPSRYIFPEGYVGWVRVDFNVKSAPALSVGDGRHLLKFPPTGYIRTSTPIEYGAAMDEYFYYSGDARSTLKSTGWGYGGMIWAKYNSAPVEDGMVYMYFFVGTEEQYKEQGVNVARDARNNPQVGPLSGVVVTEKPEVWRPDR